MISLVEQLQAEALDPSVSVVSLLLKAKAPATKLDLQDLLAWVNRELSGYAQTDDIPPYRMVQGEYKAWNPYHGWQPIIFSRSVKVPATRGVTSAIDELEHYSPKARESLAITMGVEEKAAIPHALDFAELNARLLECCRRRWGDRLRGHDETIGERLVRDRGALLPLPPTPYDACEKMAARVSSLSLVRYRGNDYSVPTAYGHREVLIRGYVHEVVELPRFDGRCWACG